MALRFLNSGYFAGKVGIGIETPTAPLDVFGVRAGRDWAINDRAVIRLDSNGAGYPSDILFGHTAAANQTSWTGAYWSLSSRGSSADNKFYFYRGAGNPDGSGEGIIMTFDPNLNVGIGTVTPDARLEVEKDVNGSFYSIFAKNPNAGSSAFVSKKWLNDDAGFGEIWRNSSTRSSVGQSALSFNMYNSADINLWSGGTHTMALVGDNVGIGTNSPAAGLQVALGSTTIPAAGASTASAVFGNSTSDDNYGVAIGANSSGVGYISSQRTDGTATTYNLAIQSNGGFVGVGTDSPDAPLHVLNDSSANVLAKIRIQGDSTSGYGDIGMQSGYIRLFSNGSMCSAWTGGVQYNYINGSTATTLNSNGLGVGTTLPDFKLDVGGTFGVSDLPFNTDSVSVLVADETIGAELITNGNFATDSDWSKGGGWAISGGTANAVSATSNPMAQTVSGFAAGNIYKVRFEVTAVTNGYIRVYAYVGASGTFTNIFSSPELTTGVYEGTFEFGGTNKILRFYGSTGSAGGFAGSIDNVSVKQVTSASNQIQKRELGTGAFGPTPVGAYLPLTAGSGFPLTGDLYLDTPAGASQSGYALKLKKTSSSSVVQVGAEIFATPWASNTNGGTIIFKNADTATNLQETLRISANGSVGINSTSSSYKLDVGGNARFQDSVYINTSTGAGGLYVTRLGGATESLKISTTDSTSVFETFQDENTGVYGSMAFVLDNGAPDPAFSFKYGSIVRLKIEGGTGDVILKDALLSNQKNTDIDTGAEVVALVSTSTYTAAFFDFVVKKTTNVRSGTVYACHDGTNVEFTETSTNDLGDTSDVTLSVDISGTNMRLLATVTSDDWSVKSLIRAI